MKNDKIKTSFVRPEGLKSRVNTTCIDFVIFSKIFVENCLYYDAINYFLVWLRTSSNLTDINRFRSHTGKKTSTCWKLTFDDFPSEFKTILLLHIFFCKLIGV